MTESPYIDPGPFVLPGGSVGCLLVHGFTGAPPEMRPMAEYLSGRGITVSVPLLAGHGTCVDDLAETRWEDWYATAEVALRELHRRCEMVYVGGLSQGALLGLRLAALNRVAGVIAMSPALAARNQWLASLAVLLRHLLPPVVRNPARPDFVDPETADRLWAYDGYPTKAIYQLTRLQREVRRRLPEVAAPALILFGARDGVLHPDCGRWTYEWIGAADKELVVLERSGHCVSLDAERERVWRKTHEWISERSGDGARPAA